MHNNGINNTRYKQGSFSLAVEADHPERAHWTKLPRAAPSFSSNGEVLWQNKQTHSDFPSCWVSAPLAMMQNYQYVPLTLVLYVAWIHSKAWIKGCLATLPAARNGVPVFKPGAQFFVTLYLLQSCKPKRVNRKWLLDSNICVNQYRCWTSSILYPLAEQNMPTPNQKWSEIYFGGRKTAMS